MLHSIFCILHFPGHGFKGTLLPERDTPVGVKDFLVCVLFLFVCAGVWLVFF